MKAGSRPLSLLSENPVIRSVTSAQLSRIENGEWYHSMTLRDGVVIPGIITTESLQNRFTRLGIPEDLTGLRVLDVGAATGWCSFELERRGASVVAVDCVEYEDFWVAHRLLDSKVEYLIMEVEEINPARLGRFDIVLFLGVLYHLRHPLLGLERILSVARGKVFVESFVCDAALAENDRLANGTYMEFYEATELAGQLDNWCGPSTNCLMAFCRSAGFSTVELLYIEDNRAAVSCNRKLEAVMDAPLSPAPRLSSAVNNRSGQPVFRRGADEYICVYFDAPVESLPARAVVVEVANLGVPAITVSKQGDGAWQANLRLPVDLERGKYQLRLRTRDSEFSNAVEIFVDCGPDQAGVDAATIIAAPALYRATNGLTSSNEFNGGRSEYLCCCFHVATETLREADVKLMVGSYEIVPTFVGRGDGWQANGRLPRELAPGVYPVRVLLMGGLESNARSIVVKA